MTSYFIYSNKPKKGEISQDQKQIVTFPNTSENVVYLLPKTDINYYNSNGLFEYMLIDWSIQFLSTDKIFLDIGAHCGTYAITLAKYTQKTYAFEPQPQTYYALCGGVALSNIRNIECIQCGLGNESQVGKQKLGIVSLDGGGSSLHQFGTLGSVAVDVKTLDSFNIRNIGFIKIDVEDNERQVLEGAVETLRECNYPPILFESNTHNENLFGYITNILKYKIIKITGTTNMYLATK